MLFCLRPVRSARLGTIAERLRVAILPMKQFLSPNSIKQTHNVEAVGQYGVMREDARSRSQVSLADALITLSPWDIIRVMRRDVRTRALRLATGAALITLSVVEAPRAEAGAELVVPPSSTGIAGVDGDSDSQTLRLQKGDPARLPVWRAVLVQYGDGPAMMADPLAARAAGFATRSDAPGSREVAAIDRGVTT